MNLQDKLNYIKSLPGGTWFSKDKIIYWISLILLILVIFLTRGCNDKPTLDRVVTRTVYVDVPAKEGHIESQKPPKPIIKKELVIDKEYMAKYNKLKDSVSRSNLYKDAITIRDYDQTFEDTIQKVTVNSHVRGTLLGQNIDYLIKPTKIKTTETTIYKTEPNKIHILGGINVGIPLNLTSNTNVIVEGNIFIQNKKLNMIQVGFDTEKRVKVGYIRKF